MIGYPRGVSEESKGGPRWAKGDRVAVVAGRKNLGVRGEIFWVGENKYGGGWRYGLKDSSGETVWSSEENLGAPEDAPPEPEREARPVLEKGTIVEITSGKEGVGEQGEIFWVGESRFGAGMRYGVKTQNEDTFWADEAQVEVISAPEKKAAAPVDPSGPPPADAPMPEADDFADFADEADAFPDDGDIPF